jgi:hypothetical protein
VEILCGLGCSRCTLRPKTNEHYTCLVYVQICGRERERERERDRKRERETFICILLVQLHQCVQHCCIHNQALNCNNPRRRQGIPSRFLKCWHKQFCAFPTLQCLLGALRVFQRQNFVIKWLEADSEVNRHLTFTLFLQPNNCCHDWRATDSYVKNPLALM